MMSDLLAVFVESVLYKWNYSNKYEIKFKKKLKMI